MSNIGYVAPPPTAASIGAATITSGLESERPAAGNPGALYFATDTGVLWYDNGTAWTNATPRQIGYAERTTDITGIGTSETDAGISIGPFTAPTRRVIVDLAAFVGGTNAATGTVAVQLRAYDGATELTRIGISHGTAAVEEYAETYNYWEGVLSAGTHTLTTKVIRTGGTSGRILGGTAYPIKLRIREL